MRRATWSVNIQCPTPKNFYPRSPCGERLILRMAHLTEHLFLSTLSLRRATVAPLLATGSPRYFYPRSPCGERQLGRSDCGKNWPFLSTLSLRRATRLGLLGWLRVLISIHALLAESDVFLLRKITITVDISIHALLAESDRERAPASSQSSAFLSTLSLRRATCYSLRHSAQGWHFYPRSPCGERH